MLKAIRKLHQKAMDMAKAGELGGVIYRYHDKYVRPRLDFWGGEYGYSGEVQEIYEEMKEELQEEIEKNLVNAMKKNYKGPEKYRVKGELYTVNELRSAAIKYGSKKKMNLYNEINDILSKIEAGEIKPV
jgi:hypothetical protein